MAEKIVFCVAFVVMAFIVMFCLVTVGLIDWIAGKDYSIYTSPEV